MCGIFGIISTSTWPKDDLVKLAAFAEQRGRDSSGLMYLVDGKYHVRRADFPITRLVKELKSVGTSFVIGHSRLITNGLGDNQPVERDGIWALHNGIVVNDATIWALLGLTPNLQIDTEVIPAIASACLDQGMDVSEIPARILELCRGIVACALVLPKMGKLCLISNNGSLYVAKKDGNTYFSSESYPLTQVGCSTIQQVKGEPVFLDIPSNENLVELQEWADRKINLIPPLASMSTEDKLLVYPQHDLRRCSRCVLPETMPYIRFDEHGVCNYCRTYKPRNKTKPKSELIDLVAPFRRTSGNECVVPFSGGRDSCYGLHLIVKELNLRPVTYTYDWGMVTDLGRRNISRMCAELGVENIIVADDITKKRQNIAMNLRAWLKAPDLGMVSILTAGDKHFFRHAETIKRQTGISLNLWGINPLEVTHFKAGFLGVPPDFEEDRVYRHGAAKQARYQFLRFKAMTRSPGYFNRSLWDTLSGEYYRSFAAKTDYFHIFDYWMWEEKTVDDCLAQYNWERAPDTSTTWRIGDGTAAFYNYIYRTVAGFTEHDTFRSNQIREGQLTRDEALVLIEDENRPRYPNVKWYLDAIGMDFAETIRVINEIPRLYNETAHQDASHSLAASEMP